MLPNAWCLSLFKHIYHCDENTQGSSCSPGDTVTASSGTPDLLAAVQMQLCLSHPQPFPAFLPTDSSSWSHHPALHLPESSAFRSCDRNHVLSFLCICAWFILLNILIFCPIHIVWCPGFTIYVANSYFLVHVYHITFTYQLLDT